MPIYVPHIDLFRLLLRLRKDGLLQRSTREPLDVIDHDIVGVRRLVTHDDVADLRRRMWCVDLLLLNTVAEVVAPILEQKALLLRLGGHLLHVDRFLLLYITNELLVAAVGCGAA